MSARALDLTAAYDATTVRQSALRRRLLTELVGTLGEDVEIRPPLHVDYGINITIGDRTFANFGLVAPDVAADTVVGAGVAGRAQP